MNIIHYRVVNPWSFCLTIIHCFSKSFIFCRLYLFVCLFVFPFFSTKLWTHKSFSLVPRSRSQRRSEIGNDITHNYIISSPDLPQVFKSIADHSSVRLSFCSLPAKIPLVTLLAGLLLFLFDGLQGAFGGYVYTYAVKSEVDLSSAHAAYLNSLFWVRR